MYTYIYIYTYIHTYICDDRRAVADAAGVPLLEPVRDASARRMYVCMYIYIYIYIYVHTPAPPIKLPPSW